MTDSDSELVDALAQTSFLVQATLTRAAARHDLTVPQLRLLGILRDREPGTVELAGHLGLDKSSVSGLVDRAERRGLVQRRPSQQDGRAVRVCLTEVGRRLTRALSVEVDAEVSSLVAALTPAQRRSLTALLSRVLR